MSQDGNSNSQLNRDISRSSKNMGQMSTSQVGTGQETIPVDNNIQHVNQDLMACCLSNAANNFQLEELLVELLERLHEEYTQRAIH